MGGKWLTREYYNEKKEDDVPELGNTRDHCLQNRTDGLKTTKAHHERQTIMFIDPLD